MLNKQIIVYNLEHSKTSSIEILVNKERIGCALWLTIDLTDNLGALNKIYIKDYGKIINNKFTVVKEDCHILGNTKLICQECQWDDIKLYNKEKSYIGEIQFSFKKVERYEN